MSGATVKPDQVLLFNSAQVRRWLSRVDGMPPGYMTMDVVSGIASVSQLVAYSYSTAQILKKLFHLTRRQSSWLRRHQSNVRITLAIVESLSQKAASGSILEILVEVAKTAQSTLNLISRSQKPGLFGFC